MRALTNPLGRQRVGMKRTNGLSSDPPSCKTPRGAPQRDLVVGITAHHRIVHVEIGVDDAGLNPLAQHDAAFRVFALELVALQNLGHEIGGHADVIELALFECKQSRIRFFDDVDLDPAGIPDTWLVEFTARFTERYREDLAELADL